MNDSIQQNGDEVAIVIYDAPLPPKYFRLTKRFIKTLFVFVPLLLLALFFLFFSWGLGSRLRETPVPSLPSVLPESDSRLSALEAEVKTLQESNTELTNKLASGPAASAANTEDPFLMGIKKPYGMQNFLAQNRVTLDQFELVQDSNKVNLKFQIISANPENKVTGHVLVMMVSEAGMMVYPKAANAMMSQGIKYSTGEPFSVSRLRPTNAEFLHHLVGESVKFVIYIFSREGDLLLIKETESFKIGAKS
jgi:hypothetical protein